MKLLPLISLFILAALPATSAQDLQRLQYNHPGLVVDLGVGLWAWPLPMDWDGDGDIDLVVSCPDKPFNGIYFFENPGGSANMPIFKRPVRVGNGQTNIRVSHVDGEPRVLTPGREWTNFLGHEFDESTSFHEEQFTKENGRVRARQWQFADYDRDGALDIVVGEGFWGDYGWDDAYDSSGTWTNGPLHGWLYLLRNSGTTDAPDYESPIKIEAGGSPIDVFGMPSPNLADFDGDGDLDILCGEFLDGLTYFQNIGSSTKPRYAAGRRLQHAGKELAMHVQMITPTAIDWDGDGDQDLIVGDEDGRVALVEHTGMIDSTGTPAFLPPRYFQQEAGDLKFGALSTPVGVDWDGDGDHDIIAGNTAGNIAFFENLDGAFPPKWAAPILLEAHGEVIHIQAGPNGSIQGPCEAKWGYTTQTVADWDHDGLSDLMINSIWGKIVWYRNEGTRKRPRLGPARAVEVEWTGSPPKPAWNWWSPEGNELVTQWRTTPAMVDWNKNGLMDLVMLDHEGYLALFKRSQRSDGTLALLPGERIFVDGNGDTIRLNDGRAGRSGRRKLTVVDWDGDGDLDVLANSKNAEFFRNEGSQAGITTLINLDDMAERNVAGHTSSPTTIDLDRDGKPELLVGSEDGRFYHLATEHEGWK